MTVPHQKSVANSIWRKTETATCGELLDSPWRERMAVMSTFAFIRAGEFAPTLDLALRFLHHPHDLMHKAVGWMLREVGNRDRAVEEDFLMTAGDGGDSGTETENGAPVDMRTPRYREMPRTMLRYAIEKFPENLRQEYLKGLRQARGQGDRHNVLADPNARGHSRDSP